MRNLTKLTMFIALTALGMASPVLLANAQAAVIFSDDFEADTFGLNTGLINWTVTDGTIDVVGPSAFGINCGGSTKCVDLDGSSGSAGGSRPNFLVSVLWEATLCHLICRETSAVAPVTRCKFS